MAQLHPLPSDALHHHLHASINVAGEAQTIPGLHRFVIFLKLNLQRDGSACGMKKRRVAESKSYPSPEYAQYIVKSTHMIPFFEPAIPIASVYRLQCPESLRNNHSDNRALIIPAHSVSSLSLPISLPLILLQIVFQKDIFI